MTDTVLPPGSLRRRVWAAPAVRSHSLLVLTATRLYLMPLSDPPQPETIAAIENGADPEEALGPLVTTVELNAVQRLTHHLPSNTLTLEYRAIGIARVTMIFAVAEEADAAFAKLWRRLGDGFALTPHQPDAWTASRAPVAILVGLFTAIAALALTVSAADDFAAHSSPLMGLLRSLDWRVVCGIGGAALAVVQVWLYRRFTRPPVQLELIRR
jgi:hypothetical protein